MNFIWLIVVCLMSYHSGLLYSQLGTALLPARLNFTDVTGFTDFTLQPPQREGKPGLPGSAVIQVMACLGDVQALCAGITGHVGLRPHEGGVTDLWDDQALCDIDIRLCL